MSELLVYGMKSVDTNRTDNGEGKPLCTRTYLRKQQHIIILMQKIKFLSKVLKLTLRDEGLESEED